MKELPVMEKILTVVTFALLFSLPESLPAAATDDIDAEIGRVRKELASIVAEKRQVQEKAEKDYAEHRAYLKTIRQRFGTIRSEIDSLKNLQIVEKERNDSLEGAIRVERSRQRQFELLQNSFRQQLVRVCRVFIEQVRLLPPLSSGTTESALAFLESELKTKNIDNVEGIQRLFQILGTIEELTGSIQIASGPSPVPELRGTVYRLRIGTLFEAAVDAQGRNYALWTGTDSTGEALWTTGSDNATAAGILNAVNIREGKSLPSLVDLPFSNNKVHRE